MHGHRAGERDSCVGHTLVEMLIRGAFWCKTNWERVGDDVSSRDTWPCFSSFISEVMPTERNS